LAQQSVFKQYRILWCQKEWMREYLKLKLCLPLQ
jgi:hypothetical protein